MKSRTSRDFKNFRALISMVHSKLSVNFRYDQIQLLTVKAHFLKKFICGHSSVV